MKKKLQEVFLAMAAFAALTYLGRHVYLLEWLARRHFCYIWIPILLLWILRQEILARWLTLGAFGGLLLGQLAEDLKWQIYSIENNIAHSSYWGVGLWFGTVLLSLLAGLFHTWLKHRKRS